MEEAMKTINRGFVLLCLFCFMSFAAHSALGAEYIFSQIADGKSGNLAYVSTFMLNNAADTTNNIVISFFTPGGQPWVVDLHSKEHDELSARSSSFSFHLASRETANFYTGGTDPQATGWAKIQSTAPLDASVTYSGLGTNLNPPAVTFEAGVLASALASQISFEANYSADDVVPGTLVDTGFAIVNPNGDEATVIVNLLDRSGTLRGQPAIHLPPNNQKAIFVSQLFPGFQFPNPFHGMLRLSSDQNIAVGGMRMSTRLGRDDVFSTMAANPDFTLGYHPYADKEPSTSKETAQPIMLPAEILGSKNTVDANDDGDWYSVNLQAGQTLYALLVADIMGSLYQGDIKLYGAGPIEIRTSNTWAVGLNDTVLTFQAGVTATYYINVMSRTGAGTSGSSYRLFVTAR
jgi:hypothetical protein